VSFRTVIIIIIITVITIIVIIKKELIIAMLHEVAWSAEFTRQESVQQAPVNMRVSLTMFAR